MKVLLINKFLYPKGGDAIVTLNTADLIRSKGHDVIVWGMHHPLNPTYKHERYFVDYVDYNQDAGLMQQLNTAMKLLYSLEAKRKIEKLIQDEKPDIVHLHNFAHQISPSILHMFKKYNTPNVMTMHDPKLVCAAYSFMSSRGICELCKNGKYYHCFLEKCIKDSRVKSILNTSEMYLHHKLLHIYDEIDAFISPSMFLKKKLHECGFNREIFYLPNFVTWHDSSEGISETDNSIVYFGRLSREKGLLTLIKAMRGIQQVRLKIIGDGDLRDQLQERAHNSGCNNITFLGYKSGAELRKEVAKSAAVVLPSECYENNPLSIIEGFFMKKPAIGSRLGGIPELVQDNVTGFTFLPGNAKDLQNKISILMQNPSATKKMGDNAKKMVENVCNKEAHYRNLMKIYNYAVERRDKRA